MPLSQFLPLSTLKQVRDLTIDCRASSQENEWPAAWAQLTLTRLTYRLKCEGPNFPHLHHLPELLPLLESLRFLSIGTGFNQFKELVEGYILLLAGCLPQLSCLEVKVVGIPETKAAGSAINRVCTSLCMAMPESASAFMDAEPDEMKGHCLMDGRAVFTWNR